MRLFAVLLTMAAVLATSAPAQERETIGMGRLFNNDYIGDGRDRWRTGSYVLSLVTGPQPYGDADTRFGEVLEYRLRGEIIGPSSASNSDRPYVGALSLGAHTHFGRGPVHYSVGADLVAVGPQTGLSDFQEGFHEFFGLRAPATQNPVADDIFLSGSAAASYHHQVNDRLSLRPFVEVGAGSEDLLRLGGDVLIGPVGQDDLMLRDVVTGQLYQGTNDGTEGVSYLLGADLAAVSGSAFLPESEGYTAAESRARARAGVLWHPSPDLTFFYGLTYLGEEFEGQPEGQVLGSLNLNFNF